MYINWLKNCLNSQSDRFTVRGLQTYSVSLEDPEDLTVMEPDANE